MVKKTGLRSLYQISQMLAKQHLGARESVAVDLLSHWAEIVGVEHVNVIKFLSLQLPDKNFFKTLKTSNSHQPGRTKMPPSHVKAGSLTLLVHHSVVHQMPYLQSAILEKANYYFGYPALKNIIIKQKL